MQRNELLSYEKLTSTIIHAIRQHLPFDHYRIFYFGSRVKGKANPRSDFDVGIEAEQRIPLHVLARLEEALEEIPILQMIDLVDFSGSSREFIVEAKKNIELIYEQ